MSVVEQKRFVAKALSGVVAPDIMAMADYVRGQFDQDSVVGVLGYGSCLRGVSTADSLIDFYVLVRQPSQVSSSNLSARACAILPPNVYYGETSFEGRPLRTKFAVLDIETFGRWVGDKTKNPYFWARFSQPTALVWVADEEARDKIVDCVRQAVATMFGHCLGLGEGLGGDEDLWQRGLVETYKTELRAEGPARAGEIVARNEAYYREIGENFSDVEPIRAQWFLRRVQGKLFSVLRLIKASFTFSGGADYLAWKISRHSGVEIKLKPWQQRHPLLAAIYLLPWLLKKGAVR